MGPVTASAKQYISLEISFFWPEDDQSGRKIITPTIKVTVSAFQQWGMQATVGDLELAATLGGWLSKGSTFSGQMTPKRNLDSTTPGVDAVVEFWLDPEHEFDEDYHYLGRITKKRTDVHAIGEIFYDIWVPGLDDKGKLTSDSHNGGTEPYEYVDVSYQMVRLSDRKLELGKCPEKK